jgi:hypothetical protein
VLPDKKKKIAKAANTYMYAPVMTFDDVTNVRKACHAIYLVEHIVRIELFHPKNAQMNMIYHAITASINVVRILRPIHSENVFGFGRHLVTQRVLDSVYMKEKLLNMIQESDVT